MKTFIPRQDRGVSLIMALILFVLFIIFIGTLFISISRALDKIWPRPLPDEDERVRQVISEAVAEAQAANPGQTVTASAAVVVTAFVPVFRESLTNGGRMRVERSTNLVDWEVIGTVPYGENLVDTNPPPNQGFYRRIPVQ